MVGLGRLELPTSRLSGVRSNQLSYRPDCCLKIIDVMRRAEPHPKALLWNGPCGSAGREAWTAATRQEASFLTSSHSSPKRRWFPKKPCVPSVQCAVTTPRGHPTSVNILRKEVIQPQVPLRLPCYDFTPVADLTVVGCLPFGSAHLLRVKPTPMV